MVLITRLFQEISHTDPLYSTYTHIPYKCAIVRNYFCCEFSLVTTYIVGLKTLPKSVIRLLNIFEIEMKQRLRCAYVMIRPCLALTEKTWNDTNHKEILLLKAFLSWSPDLLMLKLNTQRAAGCMVSLSGLWTSCSAYLNLWMTEPETL